MYAYIGYTIVCVYQREDYVSKGFFETVFYGTGNIGRHQAGRQRAQFKATTIIVKYKKILKEVNSKQERTKGCCCLLLPCLASFLAYILVNMYGKKDVFLDAEKVVRQEDIGMGLSCAAVESLFGLTA